MDINICIFFLSVTCRCWSRSWCKYRNRYRLYRYNTDDIDIVPVITTDINKALTVAVSVGQDVDVAQVYVSFKDT